MEHLAFFNLAQDPFRNDPALDHLFRGSTLRDASRRLHRIAQQGKELTLLTGPAGAGKTTLLRSFFEDLDPDAFASAFLVISRGVEPEWLRRGVASQLGIEQPACERAEGMKELYQQIVEADEEGRRTVVIIDEAHALDSTALAELRSWMNFENDERKLVSFLFCGDPSIATTLNANAGLLERVETQVKLRGYSQDESREYLEHRLKGAGGHAGVFEDDAYTAMASAAGGVPRLLNALADNALFEAYLAGHTPVAEEDVRRAARDLPWAQRRAPGPGGIATDDLLGDLNDDSLDYVAAAFGPEHDREVNAMGVGKTNPDIEDEPAGASAGFHALDDSIGGAFERMTRDDQAASDTDDSDFDSAPVEEVADDFESDLMSPELDAALDAAAAVAPDPVPDPDPDPIEAPEAVASPGPIELLGSESLDSAAEAALEALEDLMPADSLEVLEDAAPEVPDPVQTPVEAPELPALGSPERVEALPDPPRARPPELPVMPEDDEIEGLFENLVQDD